MNDHQEICFEMLLKIVYTNPSANSVYLVEVSFFL